MKFANLYSDTKRRIEESLMGMWFPTVPPNDELRQSFNQLFEREPVIAPPFFQSMFPWEPADINTQLTDYFSEDFLDKIDLRQPYLHQKRSWECLKNNQSIVVTTGTGSGKTECFMYPVLNDLFQQKNTADFTDCVQAIFMYPLNALMEDQEERIKNWCDDLEIRYAVYNGNTPTETINGRLGRREIRSYPPQVLFSNPSMLEYILVRDKDQQIMRKSAGKLRWIILDEAHTYTGSAVLEMSLQIKRILNAFNTDINNVRFVATSATIGEDNDKGREMLRNFIKQLTGKDIEIITGNRILPELNQEQFEATLPDVEQRAKINDLRSEVNRVKGITLNEIAEILHPENPEIDSQTLIEEIDGLCNIKIEDRGLLMLRGHFFVRTLSGVYACVNPECSHNHESPLGALTTKKSSNCVHCGEPLLEVLKCNECEEMVYAGERDAKSQRIRPLSAETDVIDSDEDDNDELSPGDGNGDWKPFYAAKDIQLNPINNNITYKFIKEGNHILQMHQAIQGNITTSTNNRNNIICPQCSANKSPFNSLRIGQFNNTLSPTLLEQTKRWEEGLFASNGAIIEKPQSNFGKFIAFTDSRQKTAKGALGGNSDGEKNFLRYALCKWLFDKPIPGDIVLLRDTFVNTFGEFSNWPDIAKQQFKASIANRKPKITDFRLMLDDEHNPISNSVQKMFNHLKLTNDSVNEDSYKNALVRDLFRRRAIKGNSIESLGLVRLDYPNLNCTNIYKVYTNIRANQPQLNWPEITEQEWRNYIRICLNGEIRDKNHIVPPSPAEDMLISTFQKKCAPIYKNEYTKVKDRKYWEPIKEKQNGEPNVYQRRHKLLLCAALGIQSLDDLNEKKYFINLLLEAAFVDIIGVMQGDDNIGYVLNLTGLGSSVQISINDEVYVCPLTKKLIDTAFYGFSPLIRGTVSDNNFKRFRVDLAKPVQIKRLFDENWANFDRQTSLQWIKSDANYLKAKGGWTDLHERILLQYPLFINAEHSAQLIKSVLNQTVEQFKPEQNSLHILSCSTTMEMGVDIGDIETVLMNTVPPRASNYMQRAGRAGRKGQSRAAALTFCPPSPIGYNTFKNSTWVLQGKNAPIVKQSNTITQRHINSFFFRKFVVRLQEDGEKVSITATNEDFFQPFNGSLCDRFNEYLEKWRLENTFEQEFNSIFINLVNNLIQYEAGISHCIAKISDVNSNYRNRIREAQKLLVAMPIDGPERTSILIQIGNLQNIKLLGYLSDNQFLPNANMPTGVVEFNYFSQQDKNNLKNKIESIKNLKKQIDNSNDTVEKETLKEQIRIIRNEIIKISEKGKTSRDIEKALNEYAPGQSLIINEWRYTSAGIQISNLWQDTQLHFLFKCKSCGYADLRPIHNGPELCRCGETITPKATYEPVGFTIESNHTPDRKLDHKNKFYKIRPTLLNNYNWNHVPDGQKFNLRTGPENGFITFSNSGQFGMGFNLCPKCGRAESETQIGGSIGNHKPLWSGAADCTGIPKRNVTLMGQFPTDYVEVRLLDENNDLVRDEQIVYSVGKLLTKALATNIGVDEEELSFSTKTDFTPGFGKFVSLFIYDSAKGGCGYSKRITDAPDEVFAEALNTAENYICNCEDNASGACVECLIDRNSQYEEELLSKKKALDWLRMNYENTHPVNGAHRLTYSINHLLSKVINDNSIHSVSLFVNAKESTTDLSSWLDRGERMRSALYELEHKGKAVSIYVECPAVNCISAQILKRLSDRFTNYHLKFIQPISTNETINLMVVEKNDDTIFHYFTDCNQFGNNFNTDWGLDNSIFYNHDNILTRLVNYTIPKNLGDRIKLFDIDLLGNGNIQTQIKSIFKDHIFSKLPADFQNYLTEIRGEVANKNAKLTYSESFLNSPLACLIVSYIIQDVIAFFNLKINSIRFNLTYLEQDNRYSAYSRIHYNFQNNDDRNKFLDLSIQNILNVTPAISTDDDVAHFRCLTINLDNFIIEIRPDGGVARGWVSDDSRNGFLSHRDIDNLIDKSMNNQFYIKNSVNKKDILYYIKVIRP